MREFVTPRLPGPFRTQELLMKTKTTTTVVGFIKRGRNARHDALGIAGDLESVMCLAAVQRDAFALERDERSLRRWRALVADVAAAPEVDPTTARWLAIEHVRLCRAFDAAGFADPGVRGDAARWIEIFQADQRGKILSRFDLDFVAPLER